MFITKKSRESVEKGGPSDTAGRKVNWCRHYAEDDGDALKN